MGYQDEVTIHLPKIITRYCERWEIFEFKKKLIKFLVTCKMNIPIKILVTYKYTYANFHWYLICVVHSNSYGAC